MQDSRVFFDSARTVLGQFRIVATEQGLVSISFPNGRVKIQNQKQVPRRTQQILKKAKLFLQDFFRGKSPNSDRIPIDWCIFTKFDQRVCKALKKVPAHKIVTYSELARRAKVPKAARAVGNAMNRNPIPIVIPCHRVVRKDQTLGGYSAGLRWKRLLLKLEQGEA